MLERAMNIPTDLLYTAHDEWVRVDGDTLTLGITDFAQSELGDLVYVELPEVGAELAAADVACEVESVKAVAEVYAPVAGTVSAVNPAVDDEAEIVNTDPYGAGWLLKLTVPAGTDLSGLMSAEAYAAKVSGS